MLVPNIRGSYDVDNKEQKSHSFNGNELSWRIHNSSITFRCNRYVWFLLQRHMCN